MGAVQKLATVVVVGLVGLATLLVIYLADEPNRREAEIIEQREVAIERGIATYLQYCLVCHGPAGEGYQEPGAAGTGRIGAPLGGNTDATALNQVTDPIEREERFEYLFNVIHDGRGLMPGWGDEFSDEKIYELVTMIQNVDWDLVYNEAVEQVGGYPTPPPAPGADEEEEEAEAEEPAEGEGEAVVAADEVTIEAVDIDWNQKEVTIPANTDVAVRLVNLGAAPHDFSVDALDIDVDLPPGAEEEIVINAEPGTYEFICDVPGHVDAGMVGTLIVQ